MPVEDLDQSVRIASDMKCSEPDETDWALISFCETAALMSVQTMNQDGLVQISDADGMETIGKAILNYAKWCKMHEKAGGTLLFRKPEEATILVPELPSMECQKCGKDLKQGTLVQETVRRMLW